MPEPQITMPVAQLVDLVKHANNTLFWFNLPTTRQQSYHRCLRVLLIEYPEPSLTFELQEDSRVAATVTHTLDNIFNLLPRLSAWLEEREQR